MNLVFTVKYVRRLPEWTSVNLEGAKNEPNSSESVVQDLLSECDMREPMNASFSSTALLQANEAGVLMRTRRGSEDFRAYGPFVRTRQVAALGFDMTMTEEELMLERTVLLDWVARHAPKRRKKTVSVPDLILNVSDLDHYGSFAGQCTGEVNHKRANTMQ